MRTPWVMSLSWDLRLGFHEALQQLLVREFDPLLFKLLAARGKRASLDELWIDETEFLSCEELAPFKTYEVSSGGRST